RGLIVANGERRAGRIPRRGRIIPARVGNFERVAFCAHALDRMRQRRVSEAEVLRTLREPDETGLPTQVGRKHVRRYRTDRVAIDVIYQEYSDHLVVVTVIKLTRRTTRGHRG